MRMFLFLALALAVMLLVLFSAAMLIIGGYWLAAAIILALVAVLHYPCLELGMAWVERRHGDTA